MIYLIHNNEERNEISLIYHIKPPAEIKYYKAIEEKNLPKEKEGHSMKLIYTKSTDAITAEYTPIPPAPPTEEELLREELDQTKLELSTAITELADMVMAGSTGNV